MNLRRKVGVYEDGQDEPYVHIKRPFALDLVARGLAIIIDERSIKASGVRVQAVQSSEFLKASNQADVYHSAGKDKAPRFFQGGLQRTEHRPVPFDIFRGAKVGHQ